MTKKASLENGEAESSKKEGLEGLSDYEQRLQDANGLRRRVQSKREIMEELSRARFPWEDEG
ncbi:hypothetical protein [Polynucleobacter sphagniphilus]|uniref:Uncharacterized protein n=1 Tax=Polynucleobacter sphagniphilus TaxID=1743169 RepID=A0AA43S651_9BURK|nr:hypothetical protein [Polynucleobacter sphagniphilus]MDH6504985.1 hypothetical protein [Polynucleobacter sphagniphilus]MDH6513639.1 hypothetical protein [Polynucleobacter sphagniphilus]